MKNEHIVWAYAEMESGNGQLLVVGLTDEGVDYLQAGSGTDKKTLVINPPGRGFANVKQVIIYHEKDKAALKQRLHEAGIVVSEAH